MRILLIKNNKNLSSKYTDPNITEFGATNDAWIFLKKNNIKN